MMDGKRSLKRLIAVSWLIVVVISMAVLLCSTARAAVEHAEGKDSPDSGVVKWAFLSAAISTGCGCIGAGLAVAYVGAAAVGAVGEKPEVALRTLLFVGLAEGIAIYGLLIAIMILAKV